MTPLTDDELREIRERDSMIDMNVVAWADPPQFAKAVQDRRMLLAEVTRLRTIYETEVSDHCDEDTAIRDIARAVLGDAAVDGDSVHRPGMVDVVEAVVDRLRAEVSKLRATNGHLEQEVRIMRAREIPQ